MKTLEELIAGIPTAPPGCERFRVIAGVLQFLVVDGAWETIYVYVELACERFGRSPKTALRILEDCANASIEGWEQYLAQLSPTASLQLPYGISCYKRQKAWRDWLKTVKDAAKGERK